MEQPKKQYEKPVMIDQGRIVTETRATSKGFCWDGNPSSGNDNQKPCDT